MTNQTESTETERHADLVGQNERLVIPDGAEKVGSPPRSFRFNLGQPATVGELREILEKYPDEEMLMFRNGPLPTFYLHVLRGDNFIEFD